MVNKSIKDLDEDVWLRFTSFCKLHKHKVGTKLTTILKDFLDGEN